ncbi:MAG TPA: carbamoyltransferase HypF, partial [Candidatus Sulfotelmatobacter sp.]|nr:carbamoyltransferase HypF [Candidatus Sulfotelmatobacter sp.]
ALLEFSWSLAMTDVQTERAERLRVVIQGAVQGVGFRPFVYRLAKELGLPGSVENTAQGVLVEAEGLPQTLQTFLVRLTEERPPLAAIYSLEPSFLPATGYRDFTIRESNGTGERLAIVLPDIATCPDCLREIWDSTDRRYRYPFTNCTNCGPRFSIVRALPYDRPNTTMAGFPMCQACRREYEDPADRRFHAQPTACPACGPHLALWDLDGHTLAVRDAALSAAADAILRGEVLAAKGLGGFHLIVDATNEAAVRRLRTRKHREEKPLAIMAPSLGWVRAACEVSPLEARLLSSPEAPIVLLRRTGDGLAPSVAPGNPNLGIMLPYTPLHHLLLAAAARPLVATSGNLSDEPICTDEREAVSRLHGIADCFLVHDRPITRPVDDSVARIVLGREMVVRRARGYAPLPVHLARKLPPVLAVGAHLKNTVATAVGSAAFLSQHVGDLETAEAFEAFRRAAADLPSLYDVRPSRLACDLHPAYLSTRFAAESELPLLRVQHHFAHVLACMAENHLSPPVLGIAWDGTGDGGDGTVWGGEFLRVAGAGFSRVAHLRTFRLPGGEAAIREPRRTALGLLYAILGDAAFERDDLPPIRSFSAAERGVLRQALSRGLNAPLTSSAGRLFDAVAALLDLRQERQFEGQAAMALEWALDGFQTDEAYPFAVREETPVILDWEPTVRAILDERARGVAVGLISARFHNALVEMMLAVARRVAQPVVALTGGCFQNRYLTERAVTRLRADGFSVHWHQRVPPNDGGIALGQLLAAALEPQNASLA